MKKKRENVPQKTRDAEKREIRVYDSHDTTSFIERKKRMTLASLGIELPLNELSTTLRVGRPVGSCQPETPTKVLSLRLPTTLLNKIKAYAGQHDVPYSAMIKMILAEGIESKLRNVSRISKQ